MTMILNTTKSSRERYHLIRGPMGNYGYPPNHANHVYTIANGVDRGNGYQGYMSISYFLSNDTDYIPSSIKNTVRKILTRENLIWAE